MPYVEGLIRQVFFFREDNGYSVFKLEIIDTTEPNLLYHEPTVVISGFFPSWKRKRAIAFMANSSTIPSMEPNTKPTALSESWKTPKKASSNIWRAACSKAIGPKTAQKIVDVLGIDCLDLIANDAGVLDKVKKMPLAKKQEIYTDIALTTARWSRR
ncbi:MAG: hypothetical protein MZU97_18555 [Bacillus subtilis]|nr:hypothetical protein [Bacillus subtilis]